MIKATPTDLPTTIGAIKIETNPEEATVYIDNYIKGKTPITITDVEPGTYNITLSYPDMKSYSGNIEVREGYLTLVKYDFFMREPEPDEYIELVSDEQVVEESQLSDTELILQKLDDVIKEIRNNSESSSSISDDIYNEISTLRQYIGEDLGYNEGYSPFKTGILAITTATPNRPVDETVIACRDATASPQVTIASSGYDLIPVYALMGRRARTITLVSYSSCNLYVKVAHSKDNYDNPETTIVRGQTATFTNVYELAIRAPVSGNLNTSLGQQPGGVYSLSEDISQFNNYNLNKSAIFVNTITNVPVAGTGFAFATITGDIVNLKSVFRSSIENTDPVVYYTYQGADLTFGTRSQLGALAPGDRLEPNGTRGLTIYFASKSIPDQIVEVTTDTDLV